MLIIPNRFLQRFLGFQIDFLRQGWLVKHLSLVSWPVEILQQHHVLRGVLAIEHYFLWFIVGSISLVAANPWRTWMASWLYSIVAHYSICREVDVTWQKPCCFGVRFFGWVDVEELIWNRRAGPVFGLIFLFRFRSWPWFWLGRPGRWLQHANCVFILLLYLEIGRRSLILENLGSAWPNWLLKVKFFDVSSEPFVNSFVLFHHLLICLLNPLLQL